MPLSKLSCRPVNNILLAVVRWWWARGLLWLAVDHFVQWMVSRYSGERHYKLYYELVSSQASVLRVDFLIYGLSLYN